MTMMRAGLEKSSPSFKSKSLIPKEERRLSSSPVRFALDRAGSSSSPIRSSTAIARSSSSWKDNGSILALLVKQIGELATSTLKAHFEDANLIDFGAIDTPDSTLGFDVSKRNRDPPKLAKR